MFKSLQSRYVMATMLLVTVAYVAMGAALLFLTHRVMVDQKRTTMEQNISYVGKMLNAVYSPDFPLALRTSYLSSINLIADLSDTEMTVVDMDGSILFTTFEETGEDKRVSAATMNQVWGSAEYYQVNTLDGIFEEAQFVMASPVALADDTPIGALFVTSEATGYSNLVTRFLNLFWLSAFGTLFFLYMLIFIITRQQLKPLAAMSIAAKKYARGEFETRIEQSRIQEIDELGAAFNNMAESLSRLEDIRRSFIQNISHDLRTPMTTISGFVDGILDGTIPPEQYEYYLKLVSAETKRLSRLVRTMLTISEIESDKNTAPQREYDVCETIRQVILSFEKKIIEKNLKLKFDLRVDSMLCFGDADGIYRVVYNLVDNAIKYAFDEGTITVIADRNEKNAIISVRNTGMGIKSDELPFVFDRFYKTDKSRSLDTEGLGLGLYITKTIIEKNGGRIIVKSQYGEYCEFTFTLPLTEGGRRLE